MDRRRLLMLAPCAALGTASLNAGAATEPKVAATTSTSGVDRAIKIIANARKLVCPGSIERTEALTIGGIPQWISIRGVDRRNPVLLYVHGGPGYVSMPMNWWFGRGWEEYFTVVHWDQRGSGKTYLLNDPKVVAPTVTFERMRDDTTEMVAWLCQQFGKEKIFILGHSWGSYLGLQMALHHPERLHAYLGVGQVTNGPESERRGYAKTMDAARRDGNTKAIQELESIAPYPASGGASSLQAIYTDHRWLEYYSGVMAYRRGNTAESDLASLSPDYSDTERLRIWKGNEFVERYLLAQLLALDQSNIEELRCPLVIFAGRYDTDVNSDVAFEWFGRVRAPSKDFVWFENSAHLPMTEESGKFFASLLKYLRPIAERAGDVAP